MRPRTAGRRLALQYLFMQDVNGYGDVESPSEFFQTQRRALLDGSSDAPSGALVFDEDNPRQDEAEAFALRLIRAVEKNHDAIDRDIEKAAKNWSIARMGVIERNVIRLAAAEMRLDESPRGVILDEAVELAKRFGDGDASGAFVNGVADGIGRQET